MALNPDYIPLTSLWELHSDKDTGEFLRSGYALFTKDTERTTSKPVFMLTGSPPNYSYATYGVATTDGWRIDLNDQGAFDSIPYGYVLDEDGNAELYFIRFYSMGGVFQFSREGCPQFIEDEISPTQEVDINYIPNGQFRLHLDLPKSSNYEAGQVRSPITHCAFGGWTFERPVGSTSRDFVTFKRFSAYTSSPDKSPRYEIELECESPSPGDGYKDLRIKFDDVNKFADPVNVLTFAIRGKVALGGGINVDLVLIKNYGTGGDTATETTLTTFALTSTSQIFYHAFNFGTNVGKSIGVLNDDYVQIALRFPVDNIYDVVFTDAILTPGNVVSPIFDDTTTRQFIYRSMFKDTPVSSDGSDLYLPMTLTPEGYVPDSSVVGKIHAASYYQPDTGELLCDGTKYEAEGYSTDGIPYSRLFKKLSMLYSDTPSLSFTMPFFGTGDDFLTADILTGGDLLVSTNASGSTASPSNGSGLGGFTYRTNHIGQTDIKSKAYISGAENFVIISDNIGSVYPGFSTQGGSTTTFTINVNAKDAKSVMTVKIGSTVIASSSITFNSGNGASTQYTNVLWYKVDGVGSAPASPGATFIEVDLYTTPACTPRDHAKITAASISGKQVTQITCQSASAIPAGAYFIMESVIQSYYVWYQKDGAGTDPAPSGKIGIKVSISGTDTKDQVTSKTASAINSKYFQVPDLRGIFLRGLDKTGNVDLDFEQRYASNGVITSGEIGTLQYSNTISHSHPVYTNLSSGSTNYGLLQGTSEQDSYTTDDSGGSDSRPKNIYVNYFIKY